MGLNHDLKCFLVGFVKLHMCTEFHNPTLKNGFGLILLMLHVQFSAYQMIYADIRTKHMATM